MRTSYEDLFALFNSKGCTLLTTKQEYDDNHMVKQDKFKYIACCGHENEVHVTNFMRNSGIYCKSCANKKSLENRKPRDVTLCKSTKEIIAMFTQCLTDNTTIEWKLTPDKYLYSNLFIRNAGKEEWLMVQIRYSTTQRVSVSITDLNVSYIVVCFTDGDDIWVIPDDICKEQKCITISKKNNTKYSSFRSTKNNLLTELTKYTNHVKVDANLQNKITVVNNQPNNLLAYDTIADIVQSKQCNLHTTREDYVNEKMTTKSKLNVKMSCGHDMVCSINTFQRRKHFTCQNCVSEHLKNTSFDHEMRVSCGQILEADAFTYVKGILNSTFDCVKSHESCLADMLIRPKDITEDAAWIGVQLKSRTKSYQYTFSKIGRYPNMIILCVSLPDFRMWLFKGNDHLNKKAISIGEQRSKYHINEVLHENLCPKVLEMYQSLPKERYEKLMTPVSLSGQKEHANRLRREQLLPNLCYEYPRIDGSKYDVIINGYKVQDKCVQSRQGKSYEYVNIGSYCIGDNDFYWINSKNGSFYIIPENILVDERRIRTSLYLSNDYEKYRYDISRLIDVYEVFKRV
jgi:hypothetical protein